MGCDIHLHIEVKIAGRWEHWAHPNVDRRYDLFDAMAGVRGDERNAVKPPDWDIPADSSAATRCDFEHWSEDAHSASCLEGEDLQEIIDRFEAGLAHPFGFFLGEGYRQFLGYDFETKKHADSEDAEDCRIPPTIDGLRFVFWFDS